MIASTYNNPDKGIRYLSSAGGFFSYLAERILWEGGVVYGAAFNQSWGIEHKRITETKELDSLRRSKYVFSNLGESISRISRDLEENKTVLFVSVPCQVAAVRKKFGEHPNLILMEVVCHGAPEPGYWRDYLSAVCKKLKRSVNDISNINFRDKRSGWKNYSLTISFIDGFEFSQPHDSNPYMRAFLRDYTLREACHNCKFKYPDGSKADLTIGDFWGIEHIVPTLNNDEGTTIVISPTSKGKEISESIQNTDKIELSRIIKYNPAITNSANKPKDLEGFKRHYTDGADVIKIFNRYTKEPLLIRTKRTIRRLIKV